MIEFAQKAILFDDDTVLMVERLDSAGRFLEWELPGGRINLGEDVDEGIRREIREEVGLAIQPGLPVHVWSWMTADGSQIVAVARYSEALTCETTSKNRVPSEPLGKIKWIHIADIKELRVPLAHITAIERADALRKSAGSKDYACVRNTCSDKKTDA